MNTNETFKYILDGLEGDRTGESLRYFKLTPEEVRDLRRRFKISLLPPEEKKGKKGITKDKIQKILATGGCELLENYKIPTELKKLFNKKGP